MRQLRGEEEWARQMMSHALRVEVAQHERLASSLPDLSSEVEYAQPNFRVKVGKYYTRIDAQRDYIAVKKYFPTAIVIPDKVAIN